MTIKAYPSDKPIRSPVIQSICWDCGKALKCAWILNKKQVWREAFEKRKYYAHENREIVSYLVVACDHFEEEGNK